MINPDIPKVRVHLDIHFMHSASNNSNKIFINFRRHHKMDCSQSTWKILFLFFCLLLPIVESQLTNEQMLAALQQADLNLKMNGAVSYSGFMLIYASFQKPTCSESERQKVGHNMYKLQVMMDVR